jgi:hypothetical protein
MLGHFKDLEVLLDWSFVMLQKLAHCALTSCAFPAHRSFWRWILSSIIFKVQGWGVTRGVVNFGLIWRVVLRVQFFLLLNYLLLRVLATLLFRLNKKLYIQGFLCECLAQVVCLDDSGVSSDGLAWRARGDFSIKSCLWTFKSSNTVSLLWDILLWKILAYFTGEWIIATSKVFSRSASFHRFFNFREKFFASNFFSVRAFVNSSGRSVGSTGPSFSVFLLVRIRLV